MGVPQVSWLATILFVGLMICAELLVACLLALIELAYDAIDDQQKTFEECLIFVKAHPEMTTQEAIRYYLYKDDISYKRSWWMEWQYKKGEDRNE